MDIQDLVIFVRVAAVQNLSAVGTELGLTPGTISKRIQALETELDVRLFERTTRSIRITDEGERFLGHAQKVLSEIEQARSTLATSTGSPVGRLKVAAPELLGRERICSAVFSFIDTYPQVAVQLDLTDRLINQHEEGYDVVIHCGDLGDSTLIAKKLATDRTVHVASPSYIEKFGTPSVPADLVEHKCLALGDAFTWSITRGRDDDETVKLNVILRSNSNEVLRRAALAGTGILRTTEMQVAGDLADGTLVPVLENIDKPDMSIYAVYLNGRHALPRLRVFLDHLADQFREMKDVADTALAKSDKPAVHLRAAS